ncbi:hypothetical protein [Thalassospira mesophila]|uniref:Uncharacterized protein n=1 Tax=Thalassospira mesophila TaxID=1293891 RepID=A0A1Y2L4K8_9PROT|nr:hypothetical protein [Thalassospira mesophila]OSQ39752.1 hypothetical protein TMES_07315 [Thalassospira mesophila]
MPVSLNPPEGTPAKKTKTRRGIKTGTASNASALTPQIRAKRLAVLIADILLGQQNPDGNFPQHGFYATAFAIALWQGLDDAKYQSAIDRATTALQNQANDPRYHREFIEFALHHSPGTSEPRRKRILSGKRYRNAGIANWLILRMLCLEKGNLPSRLAARALWRFIARNFRDGAAFMDRKGCFSAQYHAFCAALLSFSTQPACRAAGRVATGLIAQLVTETGHANLIGRGAGQSFGTVSALYALLDAGEDDCATTLLDQIEQSLIATGTLPLNLLANGGDHLNIPPAPFPAPSQGKMPPSPGGTIANIALPANVLPLRAHSAPITYHPFKSSVMADIADKTSPPFPINPGPDNPDTPGWYSYNRHFDYLAFAGFFLLRAGQIALTESDNRGSNAVLAGHPVPQNPDTPFHHRTTAHYAALFNLSGGAPYDVTPMPVVTAPNGNIILPACGGEQDFASLYGADSTPLPCCVRHNHFARYDGATYQDDTILMHYHVGGYVGTRRIVFFPDAIEFTDHVEIALDGETPAHQAPQPDDIIRLFRLFLPHDLHATQHHPNRLSFPQIGLEITGSSPLNLTPSKHFSAFGPVQTLFCQKTVADDGTCHAALKLHWVTKNP